MPNGPRTVRAGVNAQEQSGRAPASLARYERREVQAWRSVTGQITAWRSEVLPAIALDVGFADAESSSRAFRKETGQSPATYGVHYLRRFRPVAAHVCAMSGHVTK